MRKLYVFLICVILGLLVTHYILNIPKRYASILPSFPWSSVVLVSTTEGYCTGFVVGEGLVATAGHCVEGHTLLAKFTFMDGKTSDARIAGYVFEPGCIQDWAVYMGDTGSHRPFLLEGPTPLVAGEEVYHIGHPRHDPRETFVSGKVLEDHYDSVLIDGSAIPGESGSALFNKAGHVVGIVTCGDASSTVAARPVMLKPFIQLLLGGAHR